MVEPALASPADSRETADGTVAAVSSFMGSLGQHFQALFSLAGLESKEAAIHALWLVALIGGGLVCVVFGYVFTILFIAFLIATLFGVSWLWVALGLALLHFAAAGVLVILAKKRFGMPVFAATAAELRKDFAGLKRNKP